MDNNTRTQIVLAAVQAAGPVATEGDDPVADWQANVQMNAARITSMCAPGSAVSQAIDGVLNAKVFTGTILSVKREKSSTRGLIHMRTKVHEKWAPDGIEKARTERTDKQAGLMMAKRCQSLIGHKVAVWIEVQTINGGDAKVRVIQHVEDLGVDPDHADGGDA